MPLPTVDGVEASTDLDTVITYLTTNAPPPVAAAITRLFKSFDRVATQAYYDEQRLKQIANAQAAAQMQNGGFGVDPSALPFPPTDPSQTPIA